MNNNELPQAISAKIDLKKITGDHAFQGKKGLWQDIVLRRTPNSKYGDDYIVVINVRGGDDVILGNARVMENSRKPSKVESTSKLPWE